MVPHTFFKKFHDLHPFPMLNWTYIKSPYAWWDANMERYTTLIWLLFSLLGHLIWVVCGLVSLHEQIPKGMYSKEIGLRAQNMITVSSSILNKIGEGGMYDHLIGIGVFTFNCKEIGYNLDFANLLVPITCFISYEKCASRKKWPSKGWFHYTKYCI